MRDVRVMVTVGDSEFVEDSERLFVRLGDFVVVPLAEWVTLSDEDKVFDADREREREGDRLIVAEADKLYWLLWEAVMLTLGVVL